jgi:hypothetical protein
MCDLIGRPMTLKRGATEVAFNGVLRGLRPEELVNSADQGTLECVIPAKQMTSIVPKKFDRIAAGGREFTIQFVRECYDGAELSAYKARVLG